MTSPGKLWIILALCACACGGDDSSAPADAGDSGAGGAGGGGGTGGGGMIAGNGGSAGTSSGGGGAGGSAGEQPTGGMDSTDAMVEDAAHDGGLSGDAGAPRPFQSILWPTDDAVVEVDAMNAFGTDVSGITYEPGTLWLSMNLAPSKLYKMEKSGATWQRVTSDGWGSGKDLLFPDGVGVPDAEGVTLAGSENDVIYVASERNLQGGGAGQSRASVLRYNTAGATLALTAEQEWNLTASLPAVGANQGLEAATWIPDSQLDGFVDPATDARYDPSAFPTHGDGLFVVGLESQSDLYFFALGSDGSVDLIATIATELDGIMGLEHDRSTGYLWAYCDDTCGNRAEILSLLPSGEFARRATVAPPASLPDINNEGIAIAPDSECAGGVKPFYWVFDGPDAHVLRSGTILCGAFLEAL